MNSRTSGLPFCWEIGFPSTTSIVTLIGAHHILDRDISGILARYIDNSRTVVFEHPLVIGENVEMPEVRKSIEKDRISLIENILKELGCPCEIGHLGLDEAVSLVQRSAFSSLGELFFMDAWAERYARETGKDIHYVETVEERDSAVSDLYINYLNSLSTKEALLGGIRGSLQDYWDGIVNVDENISGEDFYRNGVTGRSIPFLKQLVFELVRRDNVAVAFFGAIHCVEMVGWLGGESGMIESGTVLSRKVLEKIVVNKI